jgi:hypothetical protein
MGVSLSDRDGSTPAAPGEKLRILGSVGDVAVHRIRCGNSTTSVGSRR